ncbi:MAG: archaeal heat shock protein Hsp20 [Nitrososphaerales archaeon]
MFDDRKRFRDILDEIDKMMAEMEREIEDSIKNFLKFEGSSLNKPIIYGFSLSLNPEGTPTFRTFGNLKPGLGGYREPVSDQILDEQRGELRVVVELPGVEKSDIQIQALEESVSLSAERGERRYKAEIPLRAKVDPTKAKANFQNGVLEILFSLKEKTNKGFYKINIE